MIFAFFVFGINRIEIVLRVFIFTNKIRLDVGLKNALGGVFFFIGVAPDSKTVLRVTAVFKGFEIFAFV